MKYRRLGRTELEVSVIGFGTAQLRLVPEKQAVAALERAIELGVNIFHTAPDYECSEKYIGQAIANNPGKKIYVCSQGWGTTESFQYLFDKTCRNLRSDYLDLYGLASVYDMEMTGGNVWGKGGMIEFLQKKKKEGQIGHIFCTTHGPPEHTRKIIESGVFDALMIAYNDLGYYVYSQDRRTMWNFCTNPVPNHVNTDFEPEDLIRNKHETFPLTIQHDMGLIIMKPFAAGHLGMSKAFPSRGTQFFPGDMIEAQETLRSILTNEEVSCVVPGMASVAEVEENVAAGAGSLKLEPKEVEVLFSKITEVKKAVCSSCGDCNSLCSRNLPIPWLFRAGYVGQHPSAVGESWNDVEYFKLHPGKTSVCSQCDNVSCRCSQGIDIRNGLIEIHKSMVSLANKGLVPSLPAFTIISNKKKDYGARIIITDIPSAMERGERLKAGIFLENAGPRTWQIDNISSRKMVKMAISLNGRRRGSALLHQDVPVGERTYMILTCATPRRAGRYQLKLELLTHHRSLFKRDKIVLAETTVTIS